MTDAPPHSPAEDPYSRCDYRRLIAWPERIEREAPFLRRAFAGVTPRRLLDLGCGTGEHARFLASEGFEVVAVDRSPAMLEKARDQPLPPGLRFVEADLAELDGAVDGAVDGTFGGALSLGNTLPHLDDAALARLLSGLRRRLEPGAPFLLQIVNYDRVFATGQRSLPVSVRPGDAAGEEVVFLRLMTPLPEGRVVFTPTTLRYRPGAEPPVEVVRSRNVHLRGWRRAEMEERLRSSGFSELTAYGGMQGEPWEAETSPDLTMVARAAG